MIEATAVNHIGIAVRSLDAHRDYYERVLGAVYEGTEDVMSQQVRVAFYRIGAPPGAVRLELLEPTAADSPVAKFIEKRGEGVHHIAYTVADITARLAALRQHGVDLIDEAARPGAHHTRIAFLHPRSSSGVLTELVEPAPLDEVADHVEAGT
jgi:methylmalonyl-CoA/ethylmalonyl-CoA epimerase